MSMVEAGEGIAHQSKPVDLSALVRCIEAFSNSPINEWENFTKSGKAPFYDSEDITAEHYQKSWSVLSDRYDNGRSLLPSGLILGESNIKRQDIRVAFMALLCEQKIWMTEHLKN